MTDILIRNVRFRGRRIDLAIRGSRISALEDAGVLDSEPASVTIDGTPFFIRPPFYNTHTHQAMTLLRGIGDDCTLMEWLNRFIWPREARLTPRAVEAGTSLAILEGIRSGCVAFNDMYFHQPAVLRAAVRAGVRARVGLMYMDQVSEHIENDALLAMRHDLPPTVGLSLAPHALYTTTPQILRHVAGLAESLGLPIHIHAAETKAECAIAAERYGCAPVVYLDRCGLLRPGTLLAHCCHLSDEDFALIADRGCIVAHCPNSNLKLASGIFPLAKAMKAGIRVTVGTDGAASNNSLSMLAETKTAALIGKFAAGAPEAFSLSALDRAVTEDAAAALGFPNAGRIAPGADADLILVDTRTTFFAGCGDPDADFLYAADSSCIDTVICAGKILMRGRRIPNEETILEEARRAAAALAG